jgi:hypothetical protein
VVPPKSFAGVSKQKPQPQIGCRQDHHQRRPWTSPPALTRPTKLTDAESIARVEAELQTIVTELAKQRGHLAEAKTPSFRTCNAGILE